MFEDVKIFSITVWAITTIGIFSGLHPVGIKICGIFSIVFEK
jgi:hypothetical protein